MALQKDYVTSRSHQFYGYTEDDFYRLSLKMNQINKDEACGKYKTQADGSVEIAVPLSNVSLGYHCHSQHSSIPTMSLRKPNGLLSL